MTAKFKSRQAGGQDIQEKSSEVQISLFAPDHKRLRALLARGERQGVRGRGPPSWRHVKQDYLRHEGEASER